MSKSFWITAGLLVAALSASLWICIKLVDKKLERLATQKYPGALIKHDGAVCHGCIVYSMSGGLRVRVENDKDMIFMGDVTAEDDPDYYCLNDEKGPHRK